MKIDKIGWAVLNTSPTPTAVIIVDGDFSDAFSDAEMTLPSRTVETQSGGLWSPVTQVLRESGYRFLVVPRAACEKIRVKLGSLTAEAAVPATPTIQPWPKIWPLVTAVTPSRGPPGTEVTIHGEDLGKPEDAVEVTVDDLEATASNRTETEIQFQIPEIALTPPKTVNVIVKVNDESSAPVVFSFFEPSAPAAGQAAKGTRSWLRKKMVAGLLLLTTMVGLAFLVWVARWGLGEWHKRATPAAAQRSDARTRATTPMQPTQPAPAPTVPADAGATAPAPTVPADAAADAGVACVSATEYVADRQAANDPAFAFGSWTASCFPPWGVRFTDQLTDASAADGWTVRCPPGRLPLTVQTVGGIPRACMDVSSCRFCSAGVLVPHS